MKITKPLSQPLETAIRAHSRYPVNGMTENIRKFFQDIANHKLDEVAKHLESATLHHQQRQARHLLPLSNPHYTEIKDSTNNTGLMAAVLSKNPSMLRLLLQNPCQKAMINAFHHQTGETAFSLALNEEDWPMIECLVQEPTLDLSNYDHDKDCFFGLLCYAFEKMSARSVTALLERPEMQKFYQQTHKISWWNTILDRKKTSVIAETGLQIVLANLHFNPAELHKDGRTLLILAAQKNDANAVRLLLEDGRIDPTWLDHQLNNAMSYAVYNDNPDIVNLLLNDHRIQLALGEEGLQDLFFFTARHDAVNVLKLLLAKNSSLMQAVDQQGNNVQNHAEDAEASWVLALLPHYHPTPFPRCTQLPIQAMISNPPPPGSPK